VEERELLKYPSEAPFIFIHPSSIKLWKLARKLLFALRIMTAHCMQIQIQDLYALG
jgi:hypothetical protein